MEDPNPPDYLRSPFFGVESPETRAVWSAVRAVRVYIRRHGAPEGLFADWGESMGYDDRLRVSFKTFDELNGVMAQHDLSMQAFWLWPTCVMTIMHRPTQQWISIRCHAVAMPGCDIPSSRALAQAGALSVFLGAGNQPFGFEHHVQKQADNQARGA